MVDVKDWEALATKYKAHDETREIVIKRCRDMQVEATDSSAACWSSHWHHLADYAAHVLAQKQSKNAIFSLHRGDFEGAAKQLSAAETLAKELLPTVTAAPSLRRVGQRCQLGFVCIQPVAWQLLPGGSLPPCLRPVLSSCRQGSFANACEEYAEALIFQVSIELSFCKVARAPCAFMADFCCCPCASLPRAQVYLKESRVLQWKEVEWLTCDEYLGGLMDFTGDASFDGLGFAHHAHLQTW